MQECSGGNASFGKKVERLAGRLGVWGFMVQDSKSGRGPRGWTNWDLSNAVVRFCDFGLIVKERFVSEITNRLCDWSCENRSVPESSFGYVIGNRNPFGEVRESTNLRGRKLHERFDTNR